MKSRPFSLCLLIVAALLSSSYGFSQNVSDSREFGSALAQAIDSETYSAGDGDSSSITAAYVKIPPSSAVVPKPIHPFSRIGFASRMGFGGMGFDVATPLSRTFNIRAGSDFFNYATSFQEQGANVGVNIHMQSGHTSLDWFPFGGSFRLSALGVFANNNRALATALFPSGSNVTLNGQNYISSPTDPLHGSGSVAFRKVSPGLTLGFGNIVPRTKKRISIPVEAGFYYVGQPDLKVNFSGSGCDPTQPLAIGCQSVSLDHGFQQNLVAFTARANHDLSYASFFPIFSVGFGYSF